MSSLQCSKPGEQSQQQQKHVQHQQDHCFSHVTDKIKGVFGHHHGQPPVAAHGHEHGHGHSGNANAGHCKPAAGLKKKEHGHKNKEGGLLHKIKDAFSDHSSDSSDSDSDKECHKAHHKKKNLKGKKCS